MARRRLPCERAPPGLGLSCPQPDPDHPSRWVRFLELPGPGCEANDCTPSAPSRQHRKIPRRNLSPCQLLISQSLPPFVSVRHHSSRPCAGLGAGAHTPPAPLTDCVIDERRSGQPAASALVWDCAFRYAAAGAEEGGLRAPGPAAAPPRTGGSGLYFRWICQEMICVTTQDKNTSMKKQRRWQSLLPPAGR